MTVRPDGVPFQRAWFAQVDKVREAQNTFVKIWVKPINLTYFGQASNPNYLLASEPDALVRADAEAIANYMHRRLVKTITSSDKLGLTVVEQAGEKTFVIEVALIELHPTLRGLKIISDLGGFFLPGSVLVSTAVTAGASAAADPLANGSIAIEMKWSNGETGELLAEMADRRDDRAAVLINVEDFTRYGYARMNIDDWANELVEFLSTPVDHSVTAAPPFTVFLW